MNKGVYIFCLFIIQACAQKPYFGALEFLGRFPSSLSEVSGIAVDGDGHLWVIEDNGNKDILYQINEQGAPIKKLKIENAKNEDWEDLTIAKDGTVFIGDFGNNTNDRKDLIIYRIPKSQLEKKTPKAEKIKFSYPEQQKFPPKKKNLIYDAEGFFHWDGHLYVFTKNRSRPYSGITLVYKIPDEEGTHEAELVGEFILCEDQAHCSVTGADISSNGQQIALIGYGFVYLLSDFDLDSFTNPKIKRVDLKYPTQIEAVCYKNERTLYIADEQSQTKGRNLYCYKITE